MKFIWGLFFLISIAQAGELTTPSFFSLKKCWEDLADQKFQKKIELDALKEKMDVLWPTSQKINQSKIWLIKDGKGVRKRISLKIETQAAAANNSNISRKILSVEKLESNGAGESISIPAQHRVNPNQKIINEYLIQSDVEQLETVDLELKTIGANLVALEIVAKNNKLQSLKLKDAKNKKALSCEATAQLGVVCVCSAK